MSDHTAVIENNVRSASSPSALRITDLRVARVEEIQMSESLK